MKLIAFCVYDKVSKKYDVPQYCNDFNVVLRELKINCLKAKEKKDIENIVKLGDLEVYKIGEFDTDNGIFSNTEKLLLVKIKDLMEVSK